MTILTTPRTPTVILNDDVILLSPFGPGRAAWAVVRESPTSAELRALDVDRLEALELHHDTVIRNDALRNYRRELILRPPAPDGGPTYRYTIPGTRVRVTTDLAGWVLEPRKWPSDRFDESAYWQLAELTFAEAMNEAVEAALRSIAAEITATLERIEARSPLDDRPLLRWFDSWHTSAEGATSAATLIRGEGGRARIDRVADVLNLTT